MLEAYSLNQTVLENGIVPFNNITIEKGSTVKLVSPGTIQFNKCGVYMVAVNAVAATAVDIQLVKDGVPQPQAQSSGTSPSFVTLVQVPKNNSNCCCVSPTIAQIINSGDASATYTSVNVVVTKVC